MHRQRTLRTAVETSGIGLHGAEPVQLRLRPAPAGTGVIFRRVDLAPIVEIDAHFDNVVETTLSTTLAAHGKSVGTVEHLLAAFAGLGVDNVLVDLTSAEVPIMDGSAGPFVDLIHTAGLVEQEAARKYLRVLQEIEVRDRDKFARFLPFEGFKVAFSIDFDHPVLQQQVVRAELDFSNACFARDLSRARTFGFMRDVELLRARGLVLGGSLDNAVVIDDHRILNREGLRSEDELVKHKILDAVGDLSLLGYPLLGLFQAHKSGHTLNNAAIGALLARPDAWELVEGGDLDPAPALAAGE